MKKTGDNKLTFGFMLGPYPPWERIIEHVNLVESLGFDKLWVPSHSGTYDRSQSEVDDAKLLGSSAFL